MTESQVLSAKRAGDIFSYEEDLKKQYFTLIKKFHPDVNKSMNATKVMVLLNSFYKEARRMFREGEWHESNCVILTGVDEKKRKISYLKSSNNELGETYVCNTVVCFLFDKDKELYYNAYIQNIKNLKYANEAMKKQFSTIVPDIVDSFKTTDGRSAIVVSKNRNDILLTDLLKHVNIIDEKHVAWIVSSLLNVACFLYYNNIGHNTLVQDSIYVNVNSHSITLLGGWEYSKTFGQKMIGLKKQAYDNLTTKTKRDKISTYTTDLECVRQVARECLRVKTPHESKKLPDAYSKWLWGAPSENSYSEYSRWVKVLEDSYGKRKFVIWDISPENIYQ